MLFKANGEVDWIGVLIVAFIVAAMVVALALLVVLVPALRRKFPILLDKNENKEEWRAYVESKVYLPLFAMLRAKVADQLERMAKRNSAGGALESTDAEKLRYLANLVLMFSHALKLVTLPRVKLYWRIEIEWREEFVSTFVGPILRRPLSAMPGALYIRGENVHDEISVPPEVIRRLDLVEPFRLLCAAADESTYTGNHPARKVLKLPQSMTAREWFEAWIVT